GWSTCERGGAFRRRRWWPSARRGDNGWRQPLWPGDSAAVLAHDWFASGLAEAYTNQITLPLSRMHTNHALTPQLNLQATAAVANRYHLASRLATNDVGGKLLHAHKYSN